MFKKFIWKFPVLLLTIFVGMLTACSDEDDDYIPIDEEWKQANSDAFLTQGFNEERYKRLDSQSGDGYILYRVIQEGSGTEDIYYTSTVSVYYKGCFIRDEEGNILENLDEVLEKGEVFDSVTRESGAEPAEFSPSTTTDGFATALQHMHVGDRWEIWVPYRLGYGVTGMRDQNTQAVVIQPYTTLVFDIEVVGIVEQ